MYNVSNLGTIRGILALIIVGSLLSAEGFASDKPSHALQDSLLVDALGALTRSTTFLRSIATHGGYAGIYSADLTARYGEAKYDSAAASEIWIQPPGTPTVGESFLRAYRVTGEEAYLEGARAAGRALAWGQHRSGGWAHTADLAHAVDAGGTVKRREGGGTFDDETTQGALLFLMELDKTLDEPWLSETIDRGLNFILESQFENGAWPQRYPLGGGYSDYYTFNDNAINDCIVVLLKAHAQYGDDRYLAGARRAGSFIIQSQLPAPQAGWAQQYNYQMEPAWARSFEPPGLCSAVTGRNIRTLVRLHLYTDEQRYLEPIPAAVDWLKRSTIDANQWSRLYELETNRPIYGDRDGNVHYTYEEISEERRQGYGWHSSFGIPESIAYFQQAQTDAEMEYDPSSVSTLPASSADSIDQLRNRVKAVIYDLDARGRWLRDGEIRTSVFVDNVNTLCDFIARHNE